MFSLSKVGSLLIKKKLRVTLGGAVQELLCGNTNQFGKRAKIVLDAAVGCSLIVAERGVTYSKCIIDHSLL